MISLASPPQGTLRELARRPGAFLWWYADLINAAGDGLVLIWSLGLPFLPGRDPGQAAEMRPALSVAAYRRGQPQFYLLQDYGSADCAVTIGAHPLGDGRLGATTFRTTRTGGAIELEVKLDEPMPGTRERLIGSLTLGGADCLAPDGGAPDLHCWAPRVMHGSGRASVRVGQERFELSGAGYFDSNFASVPLEQQGISCWLWGRVTFPDRTFVYYRTQSQSGETATRVLSQSAAGPLVIEAVEVVTSSDRRGRFGVRSPRRIGWQSAAGDVDLDLGALVEDGPFYQRFLVRGRSTWGETGHGVAEVVLPPRLGIRWQEPFVRMRTHALGGKNSFWLPLFSGFRHGRVRRLLGLGAA